MTAPISSTATVTMIGHDDIIVFGMGGYNYCNYDPEVDNGYWKSGDLVFDSWLRYDMWLKGL